MASKTTLKNWFLTGLKPTQVQFWEWMDSYWHKDEEIPQESIQNLVSTLNQKAELSQIEGHKNDPNAHNDKFVLKEDKSMKGQVNGYVPLDGSAKIPQIYLPEFTEFTTQEINSGGNYNNLEVTADLLVFTNENAQAILNGVWGRKEFHILNLSNTFEVQINHNSASVAGNGLPIMLPTNQGTAGIKGTARILYTEGYGYFVADTWGSKYRPEFKGLLNEQVITVDATSNASSREIIELIVFRDAQATPMSKADLNTAYPSVFRGFQVVCKSLNLIYIKTDGNTNDWKSINLTNVV